MEQKIMKWKKMTICIAVMVLLCAATCYILLKDHSMDVLWNVLKGADLRFVLLGLFLMIIFVVCEAAIIRLLLRLWNGKVSWGRAMQYSFAGFYFSSITPSSTGGQPMQLYYMVRDGVSGASASFVLLAITAVYQMTALVYGIIMMVFRFDYIAGQPFALRLLIAFGILINGLSAVFILLIIFSRPLVEKLAGWGIYLLGRLHLIKHMEETKEKAGQMIEEYSQGGRYLRQYPLVVCQTILYTVVQLTCLFIASYCACLSLGISHVGLMNFIMLQSVVSLAVSAVPLPGAVGATESSFLVMFRGFFASGQLLPVMVLGRGISFYGFLIVSGLAVLYLHLRQTSSACKLQRRMLN